MGNTVFRRAWAEINLDYLSLNLKRLIFSLKPNVKVMAVIKADAYGHGDVRVAKQLLESGADFLAVSNFIEAQRLRNNGVLAPVLVLGPTPIDMAEQLITYNISQTVHTLDYAEKLSERARSSKGSIKCHIKIETGMNRLGFAMNSESEFEDIARIYAISNLEFEGIFTHFSSADELLPSSIDYTQKQFKRFVGVCEYLENLGIDFGLRHCCNSAATVNFSGMHLDMVRPGMIIYGLPSRESEIYANYLPVMRLKSVITSIKEIAAAEYVSYGRTFKTDKKMRVGVVSIGYADGLRRGLSNNALVLVNEKPVPIIGNICMDQMMVNLNDIEDAKMWDEVTIFGDHKECNVSTMAKKLKTLHYEIVCGIARRVPRLYIKNGIVSECVDYCAFDF